MWLSVAARIARRRPKKAMVASGSHCGHGITLLLLFCFRSCDLSGAKKKLSPTPLHYPLPGLSSIILRSSSHLWHLHFRARGPSGGEYHCQRRKKRGRNRRYAPMRGTLMVAACVPAAAATACSRVDRITLRHTRRTSGGTALRPCSRT